MKRAIFAALLCLLPTAPRADDERRLQSLEGDT